MSVQKLSCKILICLKNEIRGKSNLQIVQKIRLIVSLEAIDTVTVSDSLKPWYQQTHPLQCSPTVLMIQGGRIAFKAIKTFYIW